MKELLLASVLTFSPPQLEENALWCYDVNTLHEVKEHTNRGSTAYVSHLFKNETCGVLKQGLTFEVIGSQAGTFKVRLLNVRTKPEIWVFPSAFVLDGSY